jgi:hypothetical protein
MHLFEPLEGQGRTRHVATQALESPAVPCRDRHVRVQTHPAVAQHGPFPPRRDASCQKRRYRWWRKRSLFFLSAAKTGLVLPTFFAEQQRDQEWILRLTA